MRGAQSQTIPAKLYLSAATGFRRGTIVRRPETRACREHRKTLQIRVAGSNGRWTRLRVRVKQPRRPKAAADAKAVQAQMSARAKLSSVFPIALTPETPTPYRRAPSRLSGRALVTQGLLDLTRSTGAIVPVGRQFGPLKTRVKNF
jgi:hypothetical protein